MYLSYEDYVKLGGALDGPSFNRIQLKVQKEIDYVTFGRLKDEVPARESVKMLCFELIEIEKGEMLTSGSQSDQTSDKNISSVSNDGFSVSFFRDKLSEMSDAELKTYKRNLFRQYLAGEVNDEGVPLIFSGCCTRTC